jgi:hypothetical protein
MRDLHRQLWNRQLQTLRLLLSRPADHQKAIDLFLREHAMVHAGKIARPKVWSFEDEVWEDATEEIVRQIPRGGDHSMAWTIWHIARIEDVTMNLLVAGSEQLFQREDWFKRLKIDVRDTGNNMAPPSVVKLSATIDIEALRAYRLAVGRRTREIAKRLEPEQLVQKVEPARLQRVMDEGAVVEQARGVVDYWSKRTIAGLLLMPATRHNFLHLNEALRLKQKCLKQAWRA